MTYSAEVWRKAEKYFPAVEQAKRGQADVKLNLLGEVYLDSKLWGENRLRYTGVHTFTPTGGIVANTGVNLSESEWDTLVENFHLLKELLGGKSVNVAAFKRPHDFYESVKMYVASWYLNGKPLSLATAPREFFHQEAALKEAREREPQPGKDYDSKEGEPEIQLDCMFRPPPEDTTIMRVVLETLVNEKITALMKKNCEGCRVDSPSQVDHCRSGGCEDVEIDHVDVYFDDAMKDVQLYEMMNLFDCTRKNLRLKPILAKQLAKGALAFIPKSELKERASYADPKNVPLGLIVKDALKNIFFRL